MLRHYVAPSLREFRDFVPSRFAGRIEAERRRGGEAERRRCVGVWVVSIW